LKDLWSSGSRYCTLARLGRPQIYTRVELVAMAGCAPFDLWLDGALCDEGLYVEARLNGRWALASYWPTLRPNGATGEGAPDLKRLAGEMRAKRANRPGKAAGLGEVAHHLIRHEGLLKDEGQEVAKMLGYRFDDKTWGSSAKTGARRQKRLGCGFCP